MGEIRFYHLERQSLEQALPALLSKALQNCHKIVVKTADTQMREKLNDYLWSYDPGSFLPHGTEKDGFAETQPIWITTSDENPNDADVLILAGSVDSEMMDEFDLCCAVFDGRDKRALTEARARWRSLKETDHDLTYWQQGAQGWEKKI